jgi:cytochrome c oxidase subunit II
MSICVSMMSVLAQSGAGGGGSFWLPQQASNLAPEVDWLFHFIMYLCYFFFFLIAIVMFWFAFRYRFRPGQPKPEPTASHNTALEMVWTVPPLIIVMFIAYKGFTGYMDMSVPPPNTYNIDASGQMWKWSFRYPNGLILDDLHLVKGQPVKFTLASADVLHALFIPEFRTKKDAVPGRFNQYWVTPTEAGEFPVYCAEYCGRDHSMMVSKVTVYDTPEAFDATMKRLGIWEDKFSYPERGAQLYKQRGCNACHTVDGSSGTGPTWKDMYGTPQPLISGETLVADENYLRDSIFYPGKHIVRGYSNQMPSYLGQLTEQDILALIWYMRTLSSQFDQNLVPKGPPMVMVDGKLVPRTDSTTAPAAPGNPGGPQ